MKRYMIKQLATGKWVIMKHVGPNNQWALNSHTEYGTEKEAGTVRDKLKRGSI